RSTCDWTSPGTLGSDGRPSVFSKYSVLNWTLPSATSASACSRVSERWNGMTRRQVLRSGTLPALTAASSNISHVFGSEIMPPGCETATERTPTPCFPAEVGPAGENVLATATGMCGYVYGAS